MNLIRQKANQLISSDIYYPVVELSGQQMYNSYIDYYGLKELDILSEFDYLSAYTKFVGTPLTLAYYISLIQSSLYLWMLNGKHGKHEELDRAYHQILAWQFRLHDKMKSIENNTPLKHLWSH